MPEENEQRAGPSSEQRNVNCLDRVRLAIDAVYAFDDRLHARMEASLTVSRSCWFSSSPTSSLVMIVGWMMPIETSAKLQGTAFMPACGVGAWLLFGRRLRTQLLGERERRGQCLVCGYDLRATPSRCPECGARPPFRR